MPPSGTPDTPERITAIATAATPAPADGGSHPESPHDHCSPWTGARLKAVRNPNRKIKTKEVRKLVQPDFYPDDGSLHPELMLELYYKPRHWFLEATSLAAYLKAWAGHPLAHDPEALTQAIGRDLAATVRYKVAVRCTFRLRDPDQTIITSVYACPPRYKEDKQARKAMKKARKAERDARKSEEKARKTDDRARAREGRKADRDASKREKAARKAEKRAGKQKAPPLLAYQAPAPEADVLRPAPAAKAPERPTAQRENAASATPTPRTRKPRAGAPGTATRSTRSRRAPAGDSAASTDTPARAAAAGSSATPPSSATGRATRTPRIRRTRGTAVTAATGRTAPIDPGKPDGNTD